MKDRLLKSSDKLYSRHFIHINRSTRGINVWSSTLRFLVCGMAYALLEPSFISEQYGLQGRLDMLSQQNGRLVIVELKSGKPYRENQFGLSSSHYVQTLLYDLLIRPGLRNLSIPCILLYGASSKGTSLSFLLIAVALKISKKAICSTLPFSLHRSSISVKPVPCHNGPQKPRPRWVRPMISRLKLSGAS